jgi:hypothetical protein
MLALIPIIGPGLAFIGSLLGYAIITAGFVPPFLPAALVGALILGLSF